jgi:hypothetical protein
MNPVQYRLERAKEPIMWEKGQNVHTIILIVFLVTFSINEIVNTCSHRKTVTFAGLVYPSFFYPDGSGVATNMLADLFDQMGYDTEVEVLPFARLPLRFYRRERVSRLWLHLVR